MGIEELQNAVVNRSLRSLKTELEFLLDAQVITQEQYNSIVTHLPANANAAPAALASAAPAPRAQEATPVPAMAQLNLNGHSNEKQNDYYANNSTPVNNMPPPPAYPATPAAPVYLAQASALYQYNAQDAGDLQIEPNDRIQVTEYMNAEWWKGRNERTGHEGIFPRSYVKVVEEKAPMMPAVPTHQPTNYGNVPLEVSQGGSGKEPGKGAEMGKKFGKKLGNAAIFGAGATIGSNIVNGIF